MSVSVSPQLRDIAEQLIGAPVTGMAPAGSGANSRIFRVDTCDSRFALKCYPERAGDLRKRSDIEWQTLAFLQAHGITATPRPVARDANGRYLLMEWIAGEPVTHHDDKDVDEAAGFIAGIFALSRDPQAQTFSPASEACLSTAEIVRQIAARVAALAPEPHVQRFLSEIVMPIFDERREVLASDIAAGTEIHSSQKRLIPADFGFHNALRAADGSLRYIDFDYFGWDDPVKLTADFILHPGMTLTAQEKRLFVQRMIGTLPDDPDFGARLDRTLPLYAARWALILLNPFRSDRAAELPADPDARSRLFDDRAQKAARVLAAIR
jgi:hypothetical protein